MSTRGKDFISYATNRVVGTIGDAGNAQAAIKALLDAGFEREDIDILHGEEDVRRLDPTGAEHGFLAQFQRTMIRAFDLDEFKHLTHHVEDVRAGRFVIMVLVKRRIHRIAAADILNRHGADYVGFHGRWAWEGIPAMPHRSPEEFPGLFAQAWNDRNPDALAALFDEDGQFLNVTGQCCRDRDAIRRAHAQGVGIFSNSVLAVDDTTVKLLSPDVALVHARMTLSAPAPADTVAPPLARTTMVSFVVHRTVDWWKWQCASAHHTDVVPTVDAGVINEAGVSGLSNYPRGQAS